MQVTGQALGVILAAAIDKGWLPFYVLAGLLLLGAACSGGVLARMVSRRGEALVLGTLAFAVVAWWSRVRFGIPGHTALVWGWVGSAAAGAILAVVAPPTETGPSPRRESGRGRSVLVGTAVVLMTVVLAGLVRSGVAHQVADKATTYTRFDAEQLGRTLAGSDAHTANDLALVAVHNGPSRHVVRAEGDRDAEGAELVVRITSSSVGTNVLTRCWRYRLRNDPDDHLPAPVGCPDAPPAVSVVSVSSQYNDGLYDALLQLPPESSDDLDAIRDVVLETADFYVASSGTDIQVDRLGGGLVGVALKVGLTDCLITRIDTKDREAAISTWLPDPTLLRSDQPGCVPALAR